MSRSAGVLRISIAKQLCGGGPKIFCGRRCGKVRRVAREVVEHAVRHEGNVLGKVEASGYDEEGEEEEEYGVWRTVSQRVDRNRKWTLAVGFH